MSIEVVTSPSVEPVSLAEAKAHARVFDDLTDDDDYIAGLIVAAREKVEAMSRRAFIERTVDESYDGFPCGSDSIRFGVSPVRSLVSISYVDASGAAQTLDPSSYAVRPGTPGLVKPIWGSSWPSDASDVVVRLVAGYGPDAASVPALAKLAIKILVAHWYDRREPIVTGTIVADVPFTLDALVDPLRRGVYPR